MTIARQEYQGSMYIGDSVPPTANKPFWGQITADSGGFYSWTEVFPFTPGTFQKSPGGRFGSAGFMPAINPNGFVISQFPTIALLQRGYLDAVKNVVYMIISIGGNPGSSPVVRVPSSGAANTLVAAFVETWTDTAGIPTSTDGTSCWVYEVMGNAVTSGFYPGASFLCLHSDGQPIYGVRSGFSGTKQVCEGDQTLHTWTFENGWLVSA